MRKNRKRLVLSDLHVPYHDKAVFAAWLDMCRREQPDVIDIIGDLVDCYSVSFFDKDPARRLILMDELDVALEVLNQIVAAAPAGCEINYHEGNHEYRLRRFVKKIAGTLAGLVRSVPEVLGLDSLGINWFPYGTPQRNSWGCIGHGWQVRAHAGMSARAQSDKCGRTLVVGDCHRMGYSPYTNWSGETLDAIEVGHMSDVVFAEYCKMPPNWQLGWAMLYEQRRGEFIDFQFARVRKVGKIKRIYTFNNQVWPI